MFEVVAAKEPTPPNVPSSPAAAAAAARPNAASPE
eukprot:CAMPEP_0194759298 /NCGR_PEP_ID=MMETSP0323_2-20130528/12370_1 /TAXON_ID=2866 ORGANISM="Crypthecodinium cohnii, Strain Seligo" /NCGR_SAMPLE_ID=MMETSP0323_2 /ASSEMBLY_ACC=CAM_ASM_000346 /LENGTH=34 /DNA_ID= /DNA_START= /DNA_END= /DNA_ORIENTATION=